MHSIAASQPAGCMASTQLQGTSSLQHIISDLEYECNMNDKWEDKQQQF